MSYLFTSGLARINQPTVFSALQMKRSTIAGALSLVLPGAGLWYCGRPGLGLANFFLAVAGPLLALNTGFASEHILWVFLGIAVASAGFAHSIASSAER